jgi:3-dehydrotetronate 4-kinase
MLIGAIADDFTGATDLANMFVRAGMRAVQTIGVPESALAQPVDACVVALKSRTCPAEQAVAQSLAALRWLKAQGAQQIYFKYCSTFDSTAQGNIGPVTDALMQALDTDFTIACPAFPENGRTVYRGYLFVGDVLLSESGMREHPLTPMTDANLVRVLQAQTTSKVGLLRYDSVARDAKAVRSAFALLKAQGVRMAVVDALDEVDLRTIGEACEDMPLVTAGSGIGLGLALQAQARGLLEHSARATQMPSCSGLSAVVSGSCSTATNAQVAHWKSLGHAAMQVDALAVAAALSGSNSLQGSAAQDAHEKGILEDYAKNMVASTWRAAADQPILFYATAEPAMVRAVQTHLGVQVAGQLVEAALSAIAQELVARGVRKLVVAGGETAGAVVQALGVSQLVIGPQIDPGVPWTHTRVKGEPLALALKSGNFGGVDFFSKALAQLDSHA